MTENFAATARSILNNHHEAQATVWYVPQPHGGAVDWLTHKTFPTLKNALRAVRDDINSRTHFAYDVIVHLEDSDLPILQSELAALLTFDLGPDETESELPA